MLLYFCGKTWALRWSSPTENKDAVRTGEKEMVHWRNTCVQWCNNALQDCHSRCVGESRNRLFHCCSERMTRLQIWQLNWEETYFKISSNTGHFPHNLDRFGVVFIHRELTTGLQSWIWYMWGQKKCIHVRQIHLSHRINHITRCISVNYAAFYWVISDIFSLTQYSPHKL